MKGDDYNMGTDILGYKWPCRFTFHVVRNKNSSKQIVVATVCKQKCKLENIKLESVKSFSWNNDEKTAVIDVRELENEDAFKNHLSQLSVFWGTY